MNWNWSSPHPPVEFWPFFLVSAVLVGLLIWFCKS